MLTAEAYIRKTQLMSTMQMLSCC